MSRTVLINRIVAVQKLAVDFTASAIAARGQGAYGWGPESTLLSEHFRRTRCGVLTVGY